MSIYCRFGNQESLGFLPEAHSFSSLEVEQLRVMVQIAEQQQEHVHETVEGVVTGYYLVHQKG